MNENSMEIQKVEDKFGLKEFIQFLNTNQESLIRNISSGFSENAELKIRKVVFDLGNDQSEGSFQIVTPNDKKRNFLVSSNQSDKSYQLIQKNILSGDSEQWVFSGLVSEKKLETMSVSNSDFNFNHMTVKDDNLIHSGKYKLRSESKM